MHKLIRQLSWILWAALGVNRLAGAQAPTWQGAITSINNGIAYNSVVHAIATGTDGSVYVAGSFSGTVAFSTITLVSGGPYSMFVAKWNPASNSFAWAKQATITSSGYASAEAIAVRDGSLYVAGNFTGSSISFDGLPLSSAGALYRDGFVVKLTDVGSTARFNWAQQLGGPLDDEVQSLALGNNGLYLTGYFSASAKFGDKAPANSGSYDGFVAKLLDQNTSAQFGWVQPIGGTSIDKVQAVALRGDALYVAGYFINTASFGATSLTSAGAADAFVARLSDMGQDVRFNWVRQAGGEGNDDASGVAVSSSGVYLTGSLYSTAAAFGALTVARAPTTSGFVAKLTESEGTSFTWATTLGGICTSIQATGSQVYVAGYFGIGTLPPQVSSATFGGSQLGSVGAYDAFVAKLSDAGTTATVVWATQAGSRENDAGLALALAGPRLWIAGYFSGEPMTLGNVTLTQPYPGSGALFLANLTDQALATRNPEVQVSLALHPNPARGTATVRVPTGVGPVALTLLDALGRVVRTCAAPAGQDYALELAGLAPSMYTLRVLVGETLAAQKLAVE